MSKRTRGWAIAIAVLLLLPPAMLAVAAFLIQPDRFKPRIQALVAEQTGRQLSIDGHLRIGWSLQPTLSIDGVRLANLPGGSRPDMVTVERIEARLSLPALLHRRIALSRLTLVGPNILLEPVAGQPNWVFRTRPAPDATPTTGATPITSPTGTAGTTASHGMTLLVRTAHIQNGMVTFHFPQRTNVIGVRTLDYAHPRWTEPLRLDAVLVYRDFQPFTFHAVSTPTGGTFDPWTSHLEAHAFDAILQADGATTLAGPYDLALTLHAPALERLNQLLPSMRLPALHGMALSTRLSSPEPGVLPVPGQTRLLVNSADLADRVPGLSLSNLSLVLPARGGIATLGSAGRFRSQPFSINGTLTMPARWEGSSSEAATLVVTPGSPPPGGGQADTIGLRGALALRDGRFDGFTGALSLRAADLATLWPTGFPAFPALTALSLQTTIALPAGLGRISLHHLSAHAAEGDLDGDASLAVGAAPVISATLHSGRLALDRLLPAHPPGNATPFLQQRLPWDSLRTGTLDLSWRADQVGYGGQDWPDLRLHAMLAHGVLTLDLPGGLLQGHATVDSGARDAVPVRLALRAEALPLRPLAGLAGLPSPANDPVSGTLRLAVDLSARGDTPGALLSTLDGTVSMSTDGAGLDDATLSALAAPALKQLGARPSPDHHAAVRCFGLRGAATDGVLKLSSIALDTGSLVLSGVGEIDLARQTLALKLHPLARLAGSRVSVPVVVEGPFSAPAARLDAGGMDKVGLLLDALFGGDHPKTCRDAGLDG